MLFRFLRSFIFQDRVLTHALERNFYTMTREAAEMLKIAERRGVQALSTEDFDGASVADLHGRFTHLFRFLK